MSNRIESIVLLEHLVCDAPYDIYKKVFGGNPQCTKMRLKRFITKLRMVHSMKKDKTILEHEHKRIVKNYSNRLYKHRLKISKKDNEIKWLTQKVKTTEVDCEKKVQRLKDLLAINEYQLSVMKGSPVEDVPESNVWMDKATRDFIESNGLSNLHKEFVTATLRAKELE